MARRYAQGPTVRGDRVEADIPFSGFYESRWSGMIDQAEENEIEYNAEREEADGVPAELRMDEATYRDIIFRHSDYQAAHLAIAKDYVDAFARQASEVLGFKLTLGWATMVSPREYNFTTDRLFATLSKTAVKRLMVISRRNKHVELKHVIKDRFTSYDGFSSSYSNDLQAWLDVPLEDWDENEIGTLLRAAIHSKLTKHEIEDDRFGEDIYYALSEHDHEYHSDCVAWSKVEADVAEYRADKAAELRAADPDWIEPAYRCPDTPDLFASR